MAVEVRSRNGCWTCRARRKKCDETRPNCSQCVTLSIDCHGYGERPCWMDGGARERAEIAIVKMKVAGTVKRRKIRGHQPFQQYQFHTPSYGTLPSPPRTT